MSENTEWGLAAFGRHGGIEINLNEPIQEGQSWVLQLDGRDWHLAANVTGPSNVRELLEFVQSHSNREIFAEFRLGSFQAADVVIVKDSEFADRFWLRVRGTDQMLEITIQGDVAMDFEKALADLLSDLK